MRSLVGLIRAGGSSLLLTSETSVHGLPGNSLEGLMFLFDNTIDLRYIEEGLRLAGPCMSPRCAAEHTPCP